MSKRRQSRGNPFAGFLSGLVVLAAIVGVLLLGSSTEAANPTALVAPWLWLLLLGGAALFVVTSWGGKVSLPVLLVAVVLVAALVLLNSTKGVPGGDNPCPGDEVVIAAGERCYGMDGDANRAWLESKVRP